MKLQSALTTRLECLLKRARIFHKLPTERRLRQKSSMAAFRTFLGLFALVMVALGNPLLPDNEETTTFVPEGEEGSGNQCPDFDANVECPNCNFVINPLGYLADVCNPTKFYQCVQGEGWTAYHMACAPCTVWSQDDVTCLRYPDCKIHNKTESFVEIIDDEICRETRGEVVSVRQTTEDPFEYIVNDNGRETVMPCAPGTAFNLTTCDCSIVHGIVDLVTVEPPTELMCIDFDNFNRWSPFRAWGFSTPGGYWVSNNGVTLSDDGVKGKSGYFNGAAKLEIPFFTNNYNYKQFSVSLWYKRSAGSQGLMGLLSNGACAQGGSLEMYTEAKDTVQMHADSVSQISLPFSTQVLADYWHHIAIVYDNGRVSYFVDNEEPVIVNLAQGPLANRACPMSLGLIGNGDFLKGNLDEICVFGTALTNEQVKHLCDDVDIRPPATEV